jgi:hypothetical protein
LDLEVFPAGEQLMKLVGYQARVDLIEMCEHHRRYLKVVSVVAYRQSLIAAPVEPCECLDDLERDWAVWRRCPRNPPQLDSLTGHVLGQDERRIRTPTSCKGDGSVVDGR